MTNRKTKKPKGYEPDTVPNSSVKDESRFIIKELEEETRAQIEAFRRTLCVVKGSEDVTIHEAVVEMIDLAFTLGLTKKIKDFYL